jgi:hypothetical protein
VTYQFGEGGGAATMTVVRTGDTSGPASVNYSTSNGTATAGADYTTTSDTLSFAAGETSKSFTVAVLNDGDVESNETVRLTLSKPSAGVELGTNSTGTLTIADNDVAVAGSFCVRRGPICGERGGQHVHGHRDAHGKYERRRFG